MTKHPLDPALAKIRRAECHIRDLKSAIAVFLESRPYCLLARLNDEGTEEIWSIAVDPIPWEIECIAADALHNLRTPMDKMLAVAFRHPDIHMSRAKINAIQFPARDSREDFESALVGQGKHLSQAVTEFLSQAEPYFGGAGQTLWAINKLDNRDKHRALLQPIKFGFSTSEHRQVRTAKGFVLRLGSKKGNHLVPVPTAAPGAWDLHQPEPSLRPVLRLTPGTVQDYYLEFTGPPDDMEVLTTTPGSKVDADIQPILNVALGDIEGFEGEPVVDALETMYQTVAHLVQEFERRFFRS